MTKLSPNQLFNFKKIDDCGLFALMFSAPALLDIFEAEFKATTSKGIDRLNGFQFSPHAEHEFYVIASKCVTGQYRFSPYLENLMSKGRDKLPRLIGIPTVRDRVVLHQLNRYLAIIYPAQVPKNIASTYVRAIASDLESKANPEEIWVCGTDIKTFYDSIKREHLLKVLGKKIKCKNALRLIERALLTPTVPKNTRRKFHSKFRPKSGVPQGLAISNILAAIYMLDVDTAMKDLGVTYYRYVDDILMYGDKDKVFKAFKSLGGRLIYRGLSLHQLNSGKSHIGQLSNSFGYLGYTFRWPNITVRESTIERFLQSIAAKFSDYVHNKSRRLEQKKYLTEDLLAKIFLLELNERITGAISGHKRYGWIAYFNQINDLSLLYRLDGAIVGMFSRLIYFEKKAPKELRKLSRAYYEMKFNPTGGYVHNYDVITNREGKLKLLEERGQISPYEALTDDQINARYESYLHKVLSEMNADEGVLYG